MKPSIKKIDTSQEYFFIEGCHILELSNAPDDPDLSIARARLSPGRTTLWHFLSETSERYVILQGEGRVEIGEMPPRIVAPGDVVIIPPGIRQRITNTGSADLIFLAICSPRFTQDAYKSL
jgi:mannose-6-phosphate isomerase-like protein (cupin superfamily)